jgi:hypothetical protein
LKIIEAIQKGNAFVLQHTGVKGDPDFVRLVDQPDKRRSWWLSYPPALFYPEKIAKGDIIDGGEYIITIDELTGEVSILG